MTTTNDTSIRHLTQQFAQAGTLEAIYLRPARGKDCIAVQQTGAIAQRGLKGDRASSTPSRNPQGSNRQVTLIQAEHLHVVSALLGKPVEAIILRRNLVVSGINLLATKSLFKDQLMQLTIGEITLEITGACDPCSKMESLLGKGGYNAMRGHGGMTARIIKGGEIRVGDKVSCALNGS